MSDRFSRKEIKHDKFVEEMETAYGVARRNAPAILGAIAGVLVLILAVAGIFLYLRVQERKAQVRLGEAIRIFEAPVAAAGETATAPGTYASEQEKLAKAEPIFREVATRFAGRDAADVATVYLARYDVAKGDLAAAEAKLSEFAEQHEDHILAGGALASLYELKLAQGKGAEVAQELEKATDDHALPEDVRLALLARAWEGSGNAAKAAEAWRRIANEHPDSPYTLEAQRALLRY